MHQHIFCDVGKEKGRIFCSFFTVTKTKIDICCCCYCIAYCSVIFYERDDTTTRQAIQIACAEFLEYMLCCCLKYTMLNSCYYFDGK